MIQSFVQSMLMLFRIYRSLRYMFRPKYCRHLQSHTYKHLRYTYQMSHCTLLHLQSIYTHCLPHHSKNLLFVQRKLTLYHICMILSYRSHQSCYKHLLIHIYIRHLYKCQKYQCMPLLLMSIYIRCLLHHRKYQMSVRHRLRQFRICKLQSCMFHL